MKHLLAAVILLMCTACSKERDGAIVSLFENPDLWRPFPICLSIKGNDPAPELLAAIRKVNHRVVAESSCKISKSGYGYVSTDNKNAEVFYIEQIAWRSPTRVAVTASWNTGFMLGGSGSLYTIERLNGFWIVTKVEMEWIS